MSRAITRPTEYVHPLRNLRAAVLATVPTPTPPELVAALDALAAEWNALYEVVYAAGEYVETRAEADRAGLVRAFDAWQARIERGVEPNGRVWLVAGEGDMFARGEAASGYPAPEVQPLPDDADTPF